jgi:hypothetical protein
MRRAPTRISKGITLGDVAHYLASNYLQELGLQLRKIYQALGKEFLCQVQFSDSRQRKFKKITFLPPIFFYPQHTLIQNLHSNLA